MSDPRFARLKSDPRFRRIKKDKNKIIVDERFQEVFASSKKKNSKGKGRVDKYGRALRGNHEQDNLRRFYRLEDEDGGGDGAVEPQSAVKPGPDYARGAVLLESSDEEDGNRSDGDASDGSDAGGFITLGRDVTDPIPVPVDLDEDTFADLDAQAAAYAEENSTDGQDGPQVERTRRIAVINLDWDHVRAIHLYKIFSSLVSPAAALVASSSKFNAKEGATPTVRGKILSVKVYPSQFGKERMAREEREGPPPEVFKKKRELGEEEINERTVFETGDGEDYDEDALRKYQLERLRYYYAIVECDTVEAASHVFDELEGSELERSANVFDLSFVPDNMTFNDEPRDEANDDLSVPYKRLEFVTDALRHSKVKLTWDEDEPERNEVTRRVLSREEIEENDFRAYIASSSSEEEEEARPTKRKEKGSDRERLRALLLGGGDDTMPEGWGKHRDASGAAEDKEDLDMEITFMPGLSTKADDKDETTLEIYQRKMREKKKQRKEGMLEKKGTTKEANSKATSGLGDDFFGADSDEEDEADSVPEPKPRGKREGKGRKGERPPEPQSSHAESTAEELALITVSDNPNEEPKHFDMKAVIRAEKRGGKKRGKMGNKGREEHENDLQDDFAIDVQDDRFKAALEDHTYAIDPSNPHFKKTKSMAALLDERSRRQQEKAQQHTETAVARLNNPVRPSNLKNLVDSIKRKSAALDTPGQGKRRKL